MPEDLDIAQILQFLPMAPEYIRGSRGEGRVYEHVGLGEAIGIDQISEIQQQFLRSLQREDGNDEIAAACQGRGYLGLKNRATLLDRHADAFAISISAFAN